MIEYMMCYKLMSLIVALMVATISWGQIWMEPLHATGKTSFAIVADLTTWQKCQAEILRYRDVLERTTALLYCSRPVETSGTTQGDIAEII